MIANVVGHQTVNVSVGTSSLRSNTRYGLRIISKNVTVKPLNNKSLSPHIVSTAVVMNSQKLSERLHIVCDGKNDLSAISLLHLQRAWARPFREACRVVGGTNSSNGPRLRAYLSTFSPSNRHPNLIKTRLW